MAVVLDLVQGIDAAEQADLLGLSVGTLARTSDISYIYVLHKENAMPANRPLPLALTGGTKSMRITARVNPKLFDAATARAGTSNISEIVEQALVSLANEDDFGLRLLKRKGRIPKDIDLGI